MGYVYSCTPTTEIRFTPKLLVFTFVVFYLHTFTYFKSYTFPHALNTTITKIKKKTKKKHLHRQTVSLPFLPVFFKPNNEHGFDFSLDCQTLKPNQTRNSHFPTKKSSNLSHKLKLFPSHFPSKQTCLLLSASSSLSSSTSSSFPLRQNPHSPSFPL